MPEDKNTDILVRLAVLETQQGNNRKDIDENAATLRNIQRTLYPFVVGLGGLILDRVLNVFGS